VSVPVTLTDLETLDARVISRRVSVIKLVSRDLKRPNCAVTRGGGRLFGRGYVWLPSRKEADLSVWDHIRAHRMINSNRILHSDQIT